MAEWQLECPPSGIFGVMAEQCESVPLLVIVAGQFEQCGSWSAPLWLSSSWCAPHLVFLMLWLNSVKACP